MPLITNSKAHYDFEILDTLEAGIVLSGAEVKSIRAGHGKLEGSHIIVRGGEAYLVNASIPPFQKANAPRGYEAERNRKLLLSRKELYMLAEQERQKGLTIVPLKMYNKNHNIKLELAIARGKKKVDKRETIKKRDTKRGLARLLKRG